MTDTAVMVEVKETTDSTFVGAPPAAKLSTEVVSVSELPQPSVDCFPAVPGPSRSPVFSISPHSSSGSNGVTAAAEHGVAPPPLTGTNKRSLTAMEENTRRPLDSSARRALLAMVPPQVARPGRSNVVTESIL
ncbi:hypothetical protein TGPRC2_310510 [Toxoplasma gondii TgCatPRC2]|uniref:Uncharacterized protein n=13 Tax=Toxoplasma gondii TaxID=5811 RepID=B9PJR7_TOXGV|nr:hypothetical protein TGME49_310510 [Toxoplasma gondii ME49]EPR60915.1 hypothetical protein TGGT1_310510 [Toxoplasma gondii GT1]ESS34867.1 hypothetical protein TGVEG_310510 [Toxoplasma gondii VEG]KFG40920.1 hypothetical protein TGP89_310510 [Toxoplasma gondii p89]KFG44506.1 hypothetical protein TGDOM2_310510 [Toxoplasma gondii GAB2-2007-GAL-DOM2]KFG55813.1 hypothetical protein TGFOU_310510 [Toxoplasma gondii FOU]KFG65808.1 hypothetical protein TGRUB_310510 [Toxoplasma gondii RUB]KFH02345.1|eukprot:XP_002364297.1 hypothetical protein TGME49_310510 [Toxoplasma gondii ME49]